MTACVWLVPVMVFGGPVFLGGFLILILNYLDSSGFPLVRYPWRVDVDRGRGGTTIVGVGKGRNCNRGWTTLSTIEQGVSDFDDQLAVAVSEARARAISLNAGDKHARRKLPR